MREAVREYLTREELRQAFADEAETAWLDYERTGLHVTHAEIDAWAKSLGASHLGRRRWERAGPSASRNGTSSLFAERCVQPRTASSIPGGEEPRRCSSRRQRHRRRAGLRRALPAPGSGRSRSTGRPSAFHQIRGSGLCRPISRARRHGDRAGGPPNGGSRILRGAVRTATASPVVSSTPVLRVHHLPPTRPRLFAMLPKRPRPPYRARSAIPYRCHREPESQRGVVGLPDRTIKTDRERQRP